MNAKGLVVNIALNPGNEASTDALACKQAFTLNLPRQALFSIADAADVRISCARGSVWITLDNDLRDIVLDDGGVFSTTEHRRAVIYAMKPSCITIAPATPSSPVVSRGQPAARLVLQMQPA